MTKGARDASGYSGIRAARLEWLWEHQPEFAEQLRTSNQTEQYLDEFQRTYNALVARLMDPRNPEGACPAAGLSEELKRSDFAEWDRRAGSVPSMAAEMAYHQLVEVPEP